MKSYEDEWIKLEVSIEIIGQMIAYYVGLSSKEKAKPNSNPQLLKEYEQRIIELGQEQRACYRSSLSGPIIEKVYKEYGPFLKAQSSH